MNVFWFNIFKNRVHSCDSQAEFSATITLVFSVTFAFSRFFDE